MRFRLPCLFLLLLLTQILPVQAQSVLRVAMHADLRAIDPVWSTAYITRNHGYMIYDTLFAMNEQGEIKPQMVDGYDVSADGLTYSFTLREGLLWHDGQPVTAEDCVASIRRWGMRDTMGQTVMTFVEDMAATGSKTFTIRLKQKTGLLIYALGKPSSAVPFMMPKRIAETPHTVQITEAIGSGPFMFRRDEWKPGDRAVYVKFDRYVPRPEPASSLAGGKVARFDRIEWVVLADQQQTVNALLAGEIDMIEGVSHDLIPLVRDAPGVTMWASNPIGNQFSFRPEPAPPALRQPEDPPGPLVCLQPGGFPQGRHRRRRILLALQVGLRLPDALCRRSGHGGSPGEQHGQGPPAPAGGRL